MDKGHSIQLPRGGKSTSTQKALRTVLLAILFHTYWPKRLSRDEIIDHLAYFYGNTPVPALYRDLETLTEVPRGITWLSHLARLKRRQEQHQRAA
jgi:hypothetical protein